MDSERIKAVAEAYRELLPVTAAKTGDMRIHPRPNEALQHCAWMCDQIIAGGLSHEKAMRWICFVQGCLWTMGIKTISEMKVDNRTSMFDLPPLKQIVLEEDKTDVDRKIES